MKAINAPAIGPKTAAKNALKPYAVWKLVSGIGDGTLIYMNNSMKIAAPKPVATIVFVLTLK
jgi:hypothetical protein